MMELYMPNAVHGQLSTLPDWEKHAIIAKLQDIAARPDRYAADVHKSRSDPNRWMVRLSDRMQALLQAEDDRLTVLAVASTSQLTPYLARDGQRVA